jgi:uncharacterized membrane protein YfcA
MEFFGYLAAALVGVSLGMVGGGGSILTVPVFVYLFGLQPVVATSYSLFVVGSASLVGTFRNWKKGLINLRTVYLIGTSSVITVYITRKFIIPFIPEYLFTVGDLKVTSSLLTMTLFALLMLIASLSMIRNRRSGRPTTTDANLNHKKIFSYGIALGLITGFLGAGGGFLLIPVLVLLVRLPMQKAIGTSLFIITINSLIGFLGDIGHVFIDWIFLLIITLIAIAGIFIGDWIGKKIQVVYLKKGFGWFILVMGIYIIIKELTTNHGADIM